MALLERVAMLVRANLNDLVDKAEDPEKMLKQVILDMQNQLLQVKTQVAIALADQHLLERRQKEHETQSADFARRAELALDKGQEVLARSALERHLAAKQTSESFRQQVEDQRTQVDVLKAALRNLEQKLSEAQTRVELLRAEARRARAAGRAQAATAAPPGAVLDRMHEKVQRESALTQAQAELATETVEDRLAALEKEEEIDRLLNELKARRGGGS